MQGHILTDRQRQVAQDVSSRTGRSVDDSMKQMLQDVPAGRYGLTEEVGYLVAFLASEKASYVNGTMLAIDGGSSDRSSKEETWIVIGATDN